MATTTLDRALTGVVTAAAVATVGVIVRDGRRRTTRRVLTWEEALAQLEITPEPWQRWVIATFLKNRPVPARLDTRPRRDRLVLFRLRSRRSS